MGFKMSQLGRPRTGPVKQTKPKGPSTVQLAKNFGKAVVNHIKDGFEKVALPVYQIRLNTCNECEEFYSEGRCLHPKCGCFLSNKAWWASENCPIGKWPNEDNG